MNFLKTRYPFKLVANFFKVTQETSSTELKRNRSDSVLKNIKNLENSANKELDDVKKRVSETCVSKTSSEHSVQYNTPLSTEPSLNPEILKKELNAKLAKLKESFSSCVHKRDEENRLKLKRAYPWQNFNLNFIPVNDYPNGKKIPRNNLKLVKSSSSSTSSMISLSPASSNQSLFSTSSCGQLFEEKNAKKSSSTITLSSASSNQSLFSATRQSKKENSSEINLVTQKTPQLFKSMLKKANSSSSSTKPKILKDVTFNNLCTIYGQQHSSTSPSSVKKEKIDQHFKKETNVRSAKENSYLNHRYEPLKEEHSFIYLYSGKKQHTNNNK